VACGLVVLVGLNIGYQALSTLNQLDIIEAKRDHWQHSSEVIQALNLKPDETVVDLGCGSGSFPSNLRNLSDRMAGSLPRTFAGSLSLFYG
jgi:2-polyprenyl-3-methyl-5-hydroxy-6-metoxy-1,4-benzoquinol methylase